MACETWTKYRTLLNDALFGTSYSKDAPSLKLPDELPDLFKGCKILYVADSGTMALGVTADVAAKLNEFMIPLYEGDDSDLLSAILIFNKCECFYIKLKRLITTDDINFNDLNITGGAKYADGSGPLKSYTNFIEDFNLSGYTWYKAESSADSFMLKNALNIADSYTDNNVKVQTIPSGMFTLLKNRDKLNSLDLSNNNAKVDSETSSDCLINEKLVVRFPTKEGEFFWYLSDIEGGLKLTTRPLLQDIQALDEAYNYYANLASILLRQATNIDLMDTYIKDCTSYYRTDVEGMIWYDNPIYAKEGTSIKYYIKPYFMWIRQLAGDNICYTRNLFEAYKQAIQSLKTYTDENLDAFCNDKCSYTDPDTGMVEHDENCLSQCNNGDYGGQCIEVYIEGIQTIIGCPNLSGLTVPCAEFNNDCLVVGTTCTKESIDCASAGLDINNCIIKEHYNIKKTTGEYLGDIENPGQKISGVQSCYSGNCGYLYGNDETRICAQPMIDNGTDEDETKWGKEYTQKVSNTDYYYENKTGKYRIVYKCCS